MKELTATSKLENLKTLDIFKCYEQSEHLSIKHSSYFQVYEDLLSKYKNTKITFVEIGILNGGSLFMWKNFFGHEARIIGVDLNPEAKKWEADGFEIHIGSQSDELFWDKFFSAVGDVDIVLDDGGHTNEQQIVTTYKCIPHIKNSGMLIVEDVHSSYMKAFANPSKYSFINYAKSLIDSINSRFPEVKVSANPLGTAIYSIAIYESIVCFHIDRDRCFVSWETSNNGAPMKAKDYRNEGSVNLKFLEKHLGYLKQIQPLRVAVKTLLATFSNIKSKRYFS